jgi:hypothetical protein
MSSPNYDYLDGNAAAGELSKVFAIDITTAGDRAPNVALRDARRRHCLYNERVVKGCSGIVCRSSGLNVNCTPRTR